MISILVVVGALLGTQVVLVPVVTPWIVAPEGRAVAAVLGVSLVVGLWAGRREPAAALLVLLPGLLLTSCAPRPLTLSPTLQARVAALADRLAVLQMDPATGEPGATVLLTAWRARVAVPLLAPAPPGPPLWAPGTPEEVSNVP
jgi:hypothetical protein